MPTNPKMVMAGNIALWLLQILMALVFLMAGGSKLAGVKEMVEQFDKIGLGQWFRYLTAVLEILAAIALLIPGRSVFGALLLVPIMIGAAIAHVVVFKDSPAPPLIILAIVCVILFGRIGQLRPTPSSPKDPILA